MAVMGPSYNEESADKAYEKIMIMLKEEHYIQRFPPPKWPNYAKDRQERNEALKQAIHGLFELESWESW